MMILFHKTTYKGFNSNVLWIGTDATNLEFTKRNRMQPLHATRLNLPLDLGVLLYIGGELIGDT